jgi:hypothetical protein
MRRFLLIVFASFASFAGHLRAQPANVQADPSTGALFRPAAATFISGNSLLTTTSAASSYQPLDADLTAIAALSTTAFGRSFLPLADAAAGRTLLGLGTLATQSGTFSGTNTGDDAVNPLYSGLVSNATHTGDATGSVALTLATVNANVGSFGSATAAPTFTVNAKGLITAAGSATITPAVGSITGLGTGIATALAINTGNSGAPVLIDGALGTPTSGVGTNLTALNATQLTSGTVPDARFPATLPAASGVNLTALNASNLGSGTVPDARFPALTGEATTTAGAVAVTLTNSAVIGKVLTGYTSGAGTVAATDTILQAVQKLNGNDANLQPLDAELTAIAGISSNGLFARTGAGTAAARTITGTAAEITVINGDGVAGNPTLSLPTALTFTGKTVTGGTFASPALTTPTIGDGTAGAPSLSFASETTTGLFRPSASVLGIAVAGTSRATLTATGMTVTGTVTPTGSVHAPNGTVGNPSLSFNNDQDSGLYHIGANNLGLALGGAKVLDVATTGLGVTGTLSATGDSSFATTSGNVGIGMTPSAWNLAGYKALELSNIGNGIFSGVNDVFVTANALYNSGFKYGSTGFPATFYNQNAGQHIWKTAPSGTAGNAITFTTRATLDSTGLAVTGTGSFSGNVGVAGVAVPSSFNLATNTTGANTGGKIGTTSIVTSSSDYPYIGYNLRATGSSNTYNYDTADKASAINFHDGGFRFFTAASGTAGNAITFTERANLTTTGLAVTGNITGTGVYSTTTGSAANVFVDSAGLLQRSTSSLRYKTDLKPYQRGLADAAKLNLFTYRAKDKPDSTERFAGVGAEEMHALGFTEFVEYGPVFEKQLFGTTDPETGEKTTKFETVATKTLQPEAVRYANMIVWAFACINELAAKNDSLAARVAELEKDNASLDARMAAVEALLKK